MTFEPPPPNCMTPSSCLKPIPADNTRAILRCLANVMCDNASSNADLWMNHAGQWKDPAGVRISYHARQVSRPRAKSTALWIAVLSVQKEVTRERSSHLVTALLNRCAVLIGACCRRVHCEVKARCDRKFEVTALSSQNNPLYVKTRNGIGEWNAEPIVLRPQEWAATHKSIICSHLRVRVAIAVADYGDQIWLDKSGRSEYQYGRWQLLVQWFVRYIVLAEISLPTNSPIRLNNAASPSVSRKRRSTRLRTTMLG